MYLVYVYTCFVPPFAERWLSDGPLDLVSPEITHRLANIAACPTNAMRTPKRYRVTEKNCNSTIVDA